MGDGKVSIYSAVAATIVGSTCCALPLTLVAFGAGGAVASMASAMPWLVWLSQYKAFTFAFTAGALGVAYWQMQRASSCDLLDAKRMRVRSRVLKGAGVLFAFSVFAAYGLLPLMQWLGVA